MLCLLKTIVPWKPARNPGCADAGRAGREVGLCLELLAQWRFWHVLVAAALPLGVGAEQCGYSRSLGFWVVPSLRCVPFQRRCFHIKCTHRPCSSGLNFLKAFGFASICVVDVSPVSLTFLSSEKTAGWACPARPARSGSWWSGRHGPPSSTRRTLRAWMTWTPMPTMAGQVGCAAECAFPGG